MLEKLTLKDLSFKNKKTLMRVDFNVPLNKDGSIADDTRIKESLPSIQYILSHGGSVILISHLGRPEGKVNAKYSLSPIQQRLQELLHQPILFAKDCNGEEAKNFKAHLKPGEILLLENLRFYPAEESPNQDPLFAKQLAEGCDLYVNDAFGSAHRAHSSTCSVAQYFSDRSAMGLLMEKEYNFLKKNIDNPRRPFYAIIGGSKVSSKLGVINALFSKVDKLFIGGGMAFTLLKALGYQIGHSLVENDKLEEVKKFLESKNTLMSKIYLPEDVVIGKSPEDLGPATCVNIQQGIPQDFMGLDIGPKTLATWSEALHKGATYFWNGPLGVFENPLYSHGTAEVAQILSQQEGVKIVGGGDSIAAIHQLGLDKKFTHLSTGGGASLELIEYGHLPGIDALSNKKF